MFNILNFLHKNPIKMSNTESKANKILYTKKIYNKACDKDDLWNPETIENILFKFPKGYIEESKLFLILTECIANAALHGQARELTFTVKERHNVLLFSFKQTPKMLGRVAIVLSLARAGQIKECTENLPGGLGFPILLRLVNRISISQDYSTLRLWLHVKKD